MAPVQSSVAVGGAMVAGISANTTKGAVEAAGALIKGRCLLVDLQHALRDAHGVGAAAGRIAEGDDARLATRVCTRYHLRHWIAQKADAGRADGGRVEGAHIERRAAGQP